MLDRDTARARDNWYRAVNRRNTNAQHLVAFLVGEPRSLAGVNRHHNAVGARLDAIRDATTQRLVINASILVERCDRYRKDPAIFGLLTAGSLWRHIVLP